MSKVIEPTKVLMKYSHALEMAIQNKYDGYIELHNRMSTSFIIESVIWMSSN